MNTNKTLETQFAEFAEALKAARKGDGSLLSLEGTTGEKDRAEKLALLKLDGFVVYTLTKTGNEFQNQHTWCQFRVWVRKGWLRKTGRHVDEHDHGCIFNVLGNFDELKSLAERYLTDNLYALEDRLYLVWL